MLLNDARFAVLKRVVHRTGPLFPKVSQKSLRRLLNKIVGYDRVTTHGFRSMFKVVAEQTEFSQEVVAAALGRVSPDQIEASFPLDIVLEKRRNLMEAWGAYVS